MTSAITYSHPETVADGGLSSGAKKLDPAPLSKPYRMNFLRRSKLTKSRDEGDGDEAEIKRLEKKLTFLQKKRQLVMKIKKLERGIESGEPDGDEDTATPEKLNKMKRWVRCETNGDSFEDDISFEVDDSTSLVTKLSNCIQDTCSPTSVMDELSDFHFGLTEASRKNETVDSSSKDSNEAAKPLSNGTCSQEKVLGTEQSVDRGVFQPDIHVAFKQSDEAAGWVNMATNMLRSQTFPRMGGASNDFGQDCFQMISRKFIELTPTEPSKELSAKFAKITVTALAITGLSVKTEKMKSQSKGVNPPVRVVLSVMKNDTTSETKPFINIPSLHVVKDPSQDDVCEKNSTKHNVIGVWDIVQQDSTTGHTNSSVSFSKLVGLTGVESGAQTEPTDMNMPPSTIHLRVCIKRDDSEELLPIGVAKVLISSPRDRQLAIPLRPEYYKSMDELVKKLNAKLPQSKWETIKTFVLEDEEEVLTCARFKGFKNESYRLENDSLLRLNVTVTPEAQDKPGPLPWAPLPLLKAFSSLNEAQNTTAKGIKSDNDTNISASFGTTVQHHISSLQISDPLDDANSAASLSINELVDDKSKEEQARVEIGSPNTTLSEDTSFAGGDPKSACIDPLDANSHDDKDEVKVKIVLPVRDVKQMDGDVAVATSRKCRRWFKRSNAVKTTSPDCVQTVTSVPDSLDQNNVSTETEDQKYDATSEEEFQRRDDDSHPIQSGTPHQSESAIKESALTSEDLANDWSSQSSVQSEIIHILPDSTPMKKTEQQVYNTTDASRSWFKKAPPISNSKTTESCLGGDKAQPMPSGLLTPRNTVAEEGEKDESGEPLLSPAPTGIELEFRQPTSLIF
ncbi:hypothetical protein ACHAWO_009585 [Cyclotella atomus]|uniref:Uncharacterized protein n=1 Tax=Cyclotella atomus TaxID=382360 RepID=A0ABD3ML37_9STRA